MDGKSQGGLHQRTGPGTGSDAFLFKPDDSKVQFESTKRVQNVMKQIALKHSVLNALGKDGSKGSLFARVLAMNRAKKGDGGASSVFLTDGAERKTATDEEDEGDGDEGED